MFKLSNGKKIPKYLKMCIKKVKHDTTHLISTKRVASTQPLHVRVDEHVPCEQADFAVINIFCLNWGFLALPDANLQAQYNQCFPEPLR